MKLGQKLVLIALTCWLAPAAATAQEALPNAPAVVQAVVQSAGEDLVLHLSWQAPVDLDLFLTGPSGETIYFGNRKARTGYHINNETTCDTLAPTGLHRESATIPHAAAGLYRVSVDYIFDCGSGIEDLNASVSFTNKSTSKTLGGKSFSVSLQKLKTVAWEFEVQQK